MKITDLPEKAILEVTFLYKNKNYTMNIKLQAKIEDAILIPTICSKRKPIKLDNVTITYKTGSGIYIFNNVELKLITYQGYYMYMVSSNDDIEKLNRREAFRVFICEALTVSIKKEEGKSMETFGVLKDISLSGMGLVLNRKIEDAELMEIKIKVNDLKKVTLVGKITRVTKLSKNRGYLYGCKFNEYKEFLSRYLLKRQNQKRMSIR